MNAQASNNDNTQTDQIAEEKVVVPSDLVTANNDNQLNEDEQITSRWSSLRRLFLYIKKTSVLGTSTELEPEKIPLLSNYQ